MKIVKLTPIQQKALDCLDQEYQKGLINKLSKATEEDALEIGRDIFSVLTEHDLVEKINQLDSITKQLLKYLMNITKLRESLNEYKAQRQAILQADGRENKVSLKLKIKINQIENYLQDKIQ